MRPEGVTFRKYLDKRIYVSKSIVDNNLYKKDNGKNTTSTITTTPTTITTIVTTSTTTTITTTTTILTVSANTTICTITIMIINDDMIINITSTEDLNRKMSHLE